MNPIIITIIASTAGFILSIFAANWLNQRFIEKLGNQQREEMRGSIAQQREETRGLIEAQNKLIAQHREEMRGLLAQQREEIRGLLEAQTKLLDAKLDTINVRLIGLEQRLDRFEPQIAQRDERLERQTTLRFERLEQRMERSEALRPAA